MPLSAYLNSKKIIAPLLDEAAWQALKSYKSSLSFKCCTSPVILKTSSLGTRFFAHKIKGEDCASEGESLEHLLLKTKIMQACLDAGYEADVEVSGDNWRADVLATNGRYKIAFEVQLASQTLEETKFRPQRYAEAGIQGIWLFRSVPKHEPAEGLPLFYMQEGTTPGIAFAPRSTVFSIEQFIGNSLWGCLQFVEREVETMATFGICRKCSANLFTLPHKECVEGVITQTHWYYSANRNMNVSTLKYICPACGQFTLAETANVVTRSKIHTISYWTFKPPQI